MGMYTKKTIFFQVTAFFIVFFVGFTPYSEASDTKASGINVLDTVRETISKQPYIRIQREEVRKYIGNLQISRGPFDWNFTTSLSYKDERTPLSEADREQMGKGILDESTTNYTLGFSKKLRMGPILTPYLKVVRTNDKNIDLPAANEASVNFTITIPFLKGWGKDVTGAQETAAEMNLTASRLDLMQTISTFVFKTVVAYWNYVTAQEQLKIQSESAKRARDFLSNMVELVARGQRPASDLDQARANYADKTAGKTSAEQTLLEAKYNLGLAMGRSVKQIYLLPLPSDPLPSIPDRFKPLSEMAVRKIFATALRNRNDVAASKERKKATQVLLKAARKNVKPTLNLSMNLAYSGLKEGESLGYMGSAFGSKTEGPNYGVMIHYQFPFGNNAAKGELNAQRAAYEQASIKLNDLKRQVFSKAIVALNKVYSAISRVRSAQKSVAFYRKSVNDEIEKLKLGMSTVIDVINVEDRYTLARIKQTIAERDYAIALVNFRYETGLLLKSKEGTIQINKKVFTTLPSF